MGSRSFQQELFSEPEDDNKNAELTANLDKINQKCSSKVWFTGQGAKKHWSMKRSLLSPAYTTRWSDLPKAKQPLPKMT
ncbi:DUF4113 domain-containing protein [Marinobacter alexandrii]|uniref:DUF4113 domain-containing protein n=1 Tax=Marinobacter alexandrii TaxID=2570351 RepID=UPI001107DA44